MKTKATHLGIVIIFTLFMTLSGCRQGLNDSDIDPDVITHAKALVDFYSLDCSIFLKVCQYHSKDHWLYYYSANWNDLCAEEEDPPQYPSDLIKYKDKYILFYIRGEKVLDEKILYKSLGISSEKDIPKKPENCVEQRVWTYLKSKKTNQSIFIQSKRGIPTRDFLDIDPSDFNFFRFNE